MNNQQRPIKGWGVCVIAHNRAPPPQAVEQFVQKFIQIYESHGGVFASHPQHQKKPWMGMGNLADGGEMGKSHHRPLLVGLVLTMHSRQGLEPDW